MRQKTELISGEMLSAKNEIHELREARDRLQVSLDVSQQDLEGSQSKLAVTTKKVNTLKSIKKGKDRISGC